MIRALEEISEAVRTFWNHPRPFQKTLITPRDRLALFLSILTEVFPINGGSLSTDQVVFEPNHTLELLNGRGISLKNFWRFSLEATGQDEVCRLLEAVLDDWIDLLFVPDPAVFAIYADHDEYLTVYVHSENGLDKMGIRLESSGFEFVDYIRPPEGPPALR
jgi:hypothetical protein